MTDADMRADGGIRDRLRDAVRAFHDDERGMETLNIVMTMGISAIILIVMWQFFPKIRQWVNYMFNVVTEKDPLKF